MMPSIENVVSLTRAKKNSSGWLGHCPAHDDKNPSLGISDADDGKILVHCFAGCSQDAVISALKISSPKPSLKHSQKPIVNFNVVDSYYYWNYSGDETLRVDRLESQVGKKFRLNHRENGQWKRGDTNEKIRPLGFETWRPGEPIFLCEGEKAAKAVSCLGLSATAVPKGAKSWKPYYAESFQGMTTYILPDNDEPGRKFADAAKRDIPGATIIELPGIPPEGDAVEWIAAGGTKDELLKLAVGGGQSEQHLPLSRPLSEFERKVPTWVWKNRIPLGCVTLLEGEGGIGKGLIYTAIGSALTRGSLLPDDDTKREPVQIIAAPLEDDPGVVMRGRFDEAGADCSIVHIIESLTLDEQGLSRLEKEIERLKPILVVLDPIQAFLNRDVDMNKVSDVRSVMKPLHDIASRQQTAIVVVRHWNKNSGAQASHRGSGSSDFRNAARSVLQVIKVRESRVIVLEKSNYGAECSALTFNVEASNGSAKLKWTGKSEKSADEILAELNEVSEHKGALDEARELIDAEMAGGMKPADHMIRFCRTMGISDRTRDRAKKSLNIQSQKDGDQWNWVSSTNEGRQTSKGKNAGDLGVLGDVEESKSMQGQFEEGML